MSLTHYSKFSMFTLRIWVFKSGVLNFLFIFSKHGTKANIRSTKRANNRHAYNRYILQSYWTFNKILELYINWIYEVKASRISKIITAGSWQVFHIVGLCVFSHQSADYSIVVAHLTSNSFEGYTCCMHADYLPSLCFWYSPSYHAYWKWIKNLKHRT
jgi:hypothetical protein